MAVVGVQGGVMNAPSPTSVDHNSPFLSSSDIDILIRVYVKNLEERIKIDQMKEALSEIFSEYGNIIDLVAKTNIKAKGQAFVVFDDTESAERAIQEVQGFELFEKPMLLDYAKTRSDATVQREGTTEELELHKRRRLAEKGTIDVIKL